jgi:sulfofructose kinase
MQRGILGIGVCTLDILTKVETLPDDESVEEAESAIFMGGGPVPTALAAAAHLGSSTTMIDVLGDDWKSALIIEELRDHGIQCENIKIESGASASLASVLVRSSDGARAIRFVRSTTKAIDPQSLEDTLIKNHKIIHCNGRHLEACIKAGEIAEALGTGTVLSFDGGAGRYRESLLPLMKRIDIAIVALDFALKATSEKRLTELTWKKLNQLFPKAYIIGITDGQRGSWIQHEDQRPFHQSAFLAERIEDTTGCGDVYHGTFLHAIELEMPVNEAARMASAAGAMNASALGGRGYLPTSKQLKDFLLDAQEIQSP